MSAPAFPVDTPRLCRGRYIVAGRVGRGPIASTFRVWDTAAKAWRSLTLLAPELASGDDARAFAEACDWATSIEHPHVVGALDRGDARRVPYIVLEHSPSGTLAEWIVRNGPIPLRAASLVMIQLVDALTAIHANGAVHRLITPGALRLYGDQIKLGEIEMLVAEGTRITHPRPSVYQPADEAGRADRGSDVYAAGVTLWAMLQGELPKTTPDPGALSDLEPKLERLVRRCLARPGERWATADLLAEELVAIVSDLPDDPDGEPSLDVDPKESAVDRTAPDVGPALDPLVDPHHPFFQGEQEDEERPSWLVDDGPEPEGARRGIRSAPLPRSMTPEAVGARSVAPPKAAPSPPPAPQRHPRGIPSQPPPPPRVETPPAIRQSAPPPPAPTPAPAPAALEARAPEPRAPAPVEPRPRKTKADAEEADTGGGMSLWLKLLMVPVFGGVGVVTVAALAVVIFLGTGTLAVADGASETTLGRQQLYRVIDDERAVVDRLGGVGADRAQMESKYMDYMEQRHEPDRLDAALAYVGVVEKEAERVGPQGFGSEQAALTNSLRKLQAAHRHYEDAVAAWHAASRTTRGKAAIALGFASSPDVADAAAEATAPE